MRASSKQLLSVAVFASIASMAPAQKIGTHFAIGENADNGSPDAAYGMANDKYLVAWHRRVSGTYQIRAHRVNSNGTLASGVLAVTSGIAEKRNPAVAFVRGTNRFLIAWQERSGAAQPWRIKARTVNPATGAMSATATLVSGPSAVEPDLGGSFDPAHDGAVLAYRLTTGGVLTARIHVPLAGAPALVGFKFLISGSTDDRSVAISRSSGKDRRYVVTWTRDTNGPFRTDVFARAIDFKATPIDAALRVATTVGEERDPVVDGDGETFFVVWRRRESLASMHYDVRGRMLRISGSRLRQSGSIVGIATTSNADESNPAVSYVGNKFVVAWSRLTGSAKRSIVFQAYAADSAKKCGVLWGNSGPEDYNVMPAIGSRYAGGSSSDQALMVYASQDPGDSFDGDVFGQRIEGIGPGGPVTNLGGGCSGGGTAIAGGPCAIGNKQFRMRLAGASLKSPLALLNIAANVPPLVTCGPCEISPPTILLPLQVTSGFGEHALPIPCDLGFLGLTFQSQFYVLQSGQRPCAPLEGISFSNRLRLVIGN